MAESNKAGPLGHSGWAEDLNDGTMIRALSPRPGLSGSALTPVDEDASVVDRLVQQLRTLDAAEELQKVAVKLLGKHCFSAGVIAGIGIDVLNSAKELIQLVGIFVLADLHDLRKKEVDWWRHPSLAMGPRMLSAKLAGRFFGDELAQAAAERDAIVKELGDALSDPKALFEGVAEGVAEGYKKNWQEFKALTNDGTLTGQFRAGMIFGELLVDVLGLITGIVGLAKVGAKVATKLPRLAKFARSGKLKPRAQGKLQVSGSGGAASAQPRQVPERADSPTKPVPIKRRATAAPESPPITKRIASLNKELSDRIRAMDKGTRPDPKTYMSSEQIMLHAKEFEGGASRLMLKGNLEKYGPAQRDGTSFVMPKKDVDKLLLETKGDKRALERALGLPDGMLDADQLVRVDVPNPKAANLRIPSGNEAGANSQWLPGGKLPEGNFEAVVDLQRASKGAWTATPIDY